MSQPIYLRHALNAESILKGEISGVAYTGAVIPNYMYYKNFIVDISTLSINKKKIPLLRDHELGKVAGLGEATIVENSILIDGKLSKKTSHALEIIGLAEEGFEWELSIGVFDGVVEEIEDEVVNGHHVDHGFVLRNGILREVSIVSLGADKDTEATIFSKTKGDSKMIKMSPEVYAKLACACGGNKDTAPEDLAKLAEETNGAKEAKIEELEAKVEELVKKEEELIAKVEGLEEEVEVIKEEVAIEERVEEIEMAAKKHGVRFSATKIAEAAKSKEATEMLLSLISDMKPAGKIDEKFTRKESFSGGSKGVTKTPAEIRLAAKQLVKDGVAKNMFDAMTLVGGN